MNRIKAKEIRELVQLGAKVVYLPACTIDTTLTLYGEKEGYNHNNSGWSWDLFKLDTMFIVTGYDKPRVKGIETVDGATVKALRELDRNYNICSKPDCLRNKLRIIDLIN